MAEYRERYRQVGDSVVADPRLHLTLAVTPLTDHFNPMIAERMRAIGARVSLDPFTASLDSICCWRGDNGKGAIVLRPSNGAQAMRNLSRALAQPLARCGQLCAGWQFNPHATLLYGRTAPFETDVAPVRWNADTFVLIHSLVGETRHLEYGRWRLRSDQLTFAFD